MNTWRLSYMFESILANGITEAIKQLVKSFKKEKEYNNTLTRLTTVLTARLEESDALGQFCITNNLKTYALGDDMISDTLEYIFSSEGKSKELVRKRIENNLIDLGSAKRNSNNRQIAAGIINEYIAIIKERLPVSDHTFSNIGLFLDFAHLTNHKLETLNTKVDRLLSSPESLLDDNVAIGHTTNIGIIAKYFHGILIRTRNTHPSFILMGTDKTDNRLFPGVKHLFNYVPHGRIAQSTTKQNIWKLIQSSWAMSSNHNIVLEGNGGIGKTVTLLCASDQVEIQQRIPTLYIPLHDLVEDNGVISLEQYIDSRPWEYKDDIRALSARSWNGPSVIVLLDGFNEVPGEYRWDVLQSVNDWHTAHPSAQIITVSRPLDNLNLRENLAGETITVELSTIPRKRVRKYIHKLYKDSKIPSKKSGLWEYLVYPLFLTLYLKSERLSELPVMGYSLHTKTICGPNSMIWNYLQRELCRIRSAKWILRSAITCEYILPNIAWEMATHNRFTITRDAAENIVEQLTKSLNVELFPPHIQDLLTTYRVQNGDYPDFSKINWKSTVFSECGLISTIKDSKNLYCTFAHQHFRDCLAGVFLLNQCNLSNSSTPDCWRISIIPTILDSVAELIEESQANWMWELNRQEQQYYLPDYKKRQSSETTSILLEVWKRNHLPRKLNFSGMDLSGYSIARYCSERSPYQSFFAEASLTKGTKIDEYTLSNAGHNGAVSCIVALPDGRCITGSEDKTLRIWDINTGSTRVIGKHNTRINCVATPSKRVCVCGLDNGVLCVWNIYSHECHVLGTHSCCITTLVALSDGTCISGASDGSLRIWDINNETFWDLGLSFNATSLAALPTEGWIAGARDKYVRLFSKKGDAPLLLRKHNGYITCVAAFSDTRFVSGSSDGTLRVWDMVANTSHVFETHSDIPTCVTVLSDGRCVSGSSSGILRIGNIYSNQSIVLGQHSNYVSCITALPDGRCISGSTDGTLCVWDLSNNQSVCFSHGYIDYPQCLTKLNSNQFIVGLKEGTLRMCNRKTGRVVLYRKLLDSLKCLASDSNNTILGGMSSGLLCSINPRSGATHIIEKNAPSLTCLAASKEGGFIGGANDRTLHYWQLSPATHKVLTSAGHMITWITLLRDDYYLTGSSWNNLLHYCDLRNGDHGIYDRLDITISCIASFPNNSLLVGSTEGCLYIKNTNSVEAQLIGKHKDAITCIAVLSDSQFVSGSKDGRVCLWDLASKKYCKICFTEIDLTKYVFSEAVLEYDFARTLWQNGAIVSESNLRNLRTGIWEDIPSIY